MKRLIVAATLIAALALPSLAMAKADLTIAMGRTAKIHEPSCILFRCKLFLYV